MNLDETRRLLSFISSVCPHQRINEGTAQAWHQLLRPHDYDQSYAAARTVASREQYVNVAAIISEVRARRAHPDRIPKRGEWGACPAHPGYWLVGSEGQLVCGPCRSELIAKESA